MEQNVTNYLPGLVNAWSEPGDSEPTYLGKHIVPKRFTTTFTFLEKDGSDWTALLTIVIQDSGRPVLDSVIIKNNVERWKIKLIEQYRYLMLELSLKITIATRTPAYMLPTEYSAENVALMRAISLIGVPSLNPIMMKLPTHLAGVPTQFIRYWDGRTTPLTVEELRDISKTINTTLRKRLTPEYLQQIADIYTQAVLNSNNPISAIMDSENVKHRTASDYATKARSLGLLPDTSPGVVTIKKPTKKKGS